MSVDLFKHILYKNGKSKKRDGRVFVFCLCFGDTVIYIKLRIRWNLDNREPSVLPVFQSYPEKLGLKCVFSENQNPRTSVEDMQSEYYAVCSSHTADAVSYRITVDVLFQAHLLKRYSPNLFCYSLLKRVLMRPDMFKVE